MAGLLFIVFPTKLETYAYLKHEVVARMNGDLMFDRRTEDRRQIRQDTAAPERRHGDRRRRDITGELRAFGWAVVNRYPQPPALSPATASTSQRGAGAG